MCEPQITMKGAGYLIKWLDMFNLSPAALPLTAHCDYSLFHKSLQCVKLIHCLHKIPQITVVNYVFDRQRQ